MNAGIHVWANNPVRKKLYGKKCKAIKFVAMNTVLIEFEDGVQHVVSRNAIRRIK